jgi:hypothetical protein
MAKLDHLRHDRILIAYAAHVNGGMISSTFHIDRAIVGIRTAGGMKDAIRMRR